MKTFFSLLLLCSSLAFGQGALPGPSNGRVSRGNFLPIPQYRTPGTGTQSYFVDPTGSDTNACTASGTSACLTIQAAINRIPKLLRDQVTVSIAAGTYAGFIISGFTVDNGVQQTTGGLLIDGALATSTLATGSATGTATAGSAGSGSTFGTLTDGAATWTVNDLRGRFITTVSPTNTTLVISSNTATVITVVGTWSAPTGATTYTILDPSVIINTALSAPATPFNAATATRAAVQLMGNAVYYRASSIGIRNMRLSNAAGSGIETNDSSAIRFSTMQVRPSSASANGFFVQTNDTAEVPFLDIRLSDVSLASSGSGLTLASGRISSTNVLWRQSGSGVIGLSLGTGNGSAVGITGFSASEVLNFVSGIVLANGSLANATGTLLGNRITCTSSAGTGILIGLPLITTVGTFAHADIASITTTDITTCGIGLSVIGPSSADVTSMTGAAGTTGFDARLGGLITFAKAGVTMTAGTSEVNEDSGGVTAAFSDIAAGTCLATAPQSSRVCGR